MTTRTGELYWIMSLAAGDVGQAEGDLGRDENDDEAMIFRMARLKQTTATSILSTQPVAAN